MALFLKKFLPLGLVPLSLVVAVFIFRFNSSLDSSSEALTDKGLALLDSGEAPLVLPDTSSVVTSDNTSDTSASAPGINNYTEFIAGKIAQNIIEKNSTGPKMINGQPGFDVENPDILVSQVLSQELSGVQIYEFKPIPANPRDFSIIPGTRAAETAYLTKVQNILTARMRGVALDPKSFSFSDFSKLKESVTHILTDLYALPVPQSLAELHGREISLLVAQKNIYTALSNPDNDVVKSLVALESLEDVNKDFEDLNKDFNEFITGRNLNIPLP